MKAIQPIAVWKDGIEQDATQLTLTIKFDNLESEAVFSYVLSDADNVGAVGDVPLQRTNFIHALSCGILPTACYRIVLFFVGWQ